MYSLNFYSRIRQGYIVSNLVHWNSYDGWMKIQENIGFETKNCLMIGVASIDEKMKKNYLRWFGHV